MQHYIKRLDQTTETLHQIEEGHHLVELQEEEDHPLEGIQEEVEVEKDPRTDILFLEEDKHRKPAMANL